MNAVHLHLLINHAPMFASVAGFLLAVWGFFRKNKSLAQAGAVFLIVAGALSLVAVNSGHEAEEMVEHLPGFDHHLIHEHEEIAEIAFWTCIGVAVVAMFTFWSLVRARANAWGLVLLLCCFSLGNMVSLAWAGSLGGEIAHHELKTLENAPASHEDEGSESEEEEGAPTEHR